LEVALMLAALLILIGVALLVIAGFGVSRPRFQPQWFGFAAIALGFCWPLLNALTR
jgi:hypothetical protein